MPRISPDFRRQARKNGTLKRVVPFRISGAQTTGTNKFSFVMPEDGTYVSTFFKLLTPNTGATFIADTNKNGTTVYTTQTRRPTNAISGTGSTETATADVTSLAKGDRISVDFDQVGSTVAGSDIDGYVVYNA